MSDAAVIARLEHVSHRYGGTSALDDVSLDLPAGRIVGIIGPDGVGNSTLLALVAGVRRIQTGRVTVLGGDMAQRRHRTREAARIAYMPQGLGRNLYPTLSVFENIDFHAACSARGRRSADGASPIFSPRPASTRSRSARRASCRAG